MTIKGPVIMKLFKSMRRLISITAIAVLISACLPSEHEDKVTYLAVVNAEQQFMDAFKDKDFASLAQLYTEDGQLFPANNNVVEGHQAIEHFWRGLMDLGIHAVKLKTMEVEGSGSTIHEVGQYTIHSQDGQIVDFGKYIVIWKQQQGTWQLYRHIWTTSMTKQHGLKT